MKSLIPEHKLNEEVFRLLRACRVEVARSDLCAAATEEPRSNSYPRSVALSKCATGSTNGLAP